MYNKNKSWDKKSIIYVKKKGSSIDETIFNKLIYIYNGKKYIRKIRPTKFLYGLKLGEFCTTRVLHIYKKKIKTKLKKN